MHDENDDPNAGDAEKSEKTYDESQNRKPNTFSVIFISIFVLLSGDT